MKKGSPVIKKSISLSNTVAAWGEALANKKGFSTNFSPYIADLIRRDKAMEDSRQPGENLSGLNPDFLKKKTEAEDQIIQVVQEATRRSISSPCKN